MFSFYNLYSKNLSKNVNYDSDKRQRLIVLTYFDSRSLRSLRIS